MRICISLPGERGRASPIESVLRMGKMVERVFGVGFGRSRLALVLVVLCARWFRFICSFVRRIVLVDPVEIWPKSAKFAL